MDNCRDGGTSVPFTEPQPEVARAQNSVPEHRGDCVHEAYKTWTKDLHATPGADGSIPIKGSHVTQRNSVQFSNAVSSDPVARTYQRAERHAQLAWKATRSQVSTWATQATAGSRKQAHIYLGKEEQIETSSGCLDPETRAWEMDP
eukprot:985625-Pyramimonas_sp.AAC.1